MVGKPNQKIPKACLQPIPAIDEPFSYVIVDCVRLLPRTKLGNQHLLIKHVFVHTFSRSYSIVKY